MNYFKERTTLYGFVFGFGLFVVVVVVVVVVFKRWSFNVFCGLI